MTETASNALYTLIREQLARQGIVPDGTVPEPFISQAVLIKADKTSLLDAVYAHHGAVPLLKIGEGLKDMGHEPTLEVLLKARTPENLVQRWQRLERYVHSQHRIRLLISCPDYLEIEHYSISSSSQPSIGENMVILGVLIHLLQKIGAGDVQADIVNKDEKTNIFTKGAYSSFKIPMSTCHWRLAWGSFREEAEAIQIGDSPKAFGVDGEDNLFLQNLINILKKDLDRKWLIEDVATFLAMSKRSLQRRLTELKTTFADVVRTAQISRATELLLETDMPVSTIGLVCGFSDQPHFSRAFKRRTNISPARYRTEFKRF